MMRTVCWILAAMTLAPGARAAQKPYRISGVEAVGKRDWAPKETLTGSQQGVTFSIRYLEPEAARKAVAAALGRDPKLLKERLGDMDPGHLAFVVQIDNATDQQVRFNPAEAWLYTDKGDTKIPLDYSALYMLGQRLGPAAPSTDEVASVFFDQEAMIQPGGSVRKILAYEAPREDKFKTFEIRVVEVSVGSEPIGFSFPFRKFYED